MEPWLTVLRLDHAEPLDVEIYDNPVEPKLSLRTITTAATDSSRQFSYGAHLVTIFARGGSPPQYTFGMVHCDR